MKNKETVKWRINPKRHTEFINPYHKLKVKRHLKIICTEKIYEVLFLKKKIKRHF